MQPGSFDEGFRQPLVPGPEPTEINAIKYRDMPREELDAIDVPVYRCGSAQGAGPEKEVLR